MQIIPVIDLKSGQAVHAVRGERARYAPVQGVLGSGGDPVALVTDYRDQLGCTSCYVADLDAIAGLPGHHQVLCRLVNLNIALWVDAGISSLAPAQRLFDLGVARVIIGSETLNSGAQLENLVTRLPVAQLVLSIDLQDGYLRAPAEFESPAALVSFAARAGIRQFILLDLARVGANSGPPLGLLTSLWGRFPQLEFFAGGGVRHRGDLDALLQAKAAGALVATAFHRGILTTADVRAYHHPAAGSDPYGTAAEPG